MAETAERGNGKNKGGRPAKDSKMRENVLHVYFASQGQLQQLKDAAERGDSSVSAWARQVLLREADQVLDAGT